MNKLVLHEISIREISKGFQYDNNEEKGLFGYNGKLVIQPEYQRSYIYEEKKMEEPVVQSVLKGYPLGIVYWVEKADGTYEILDGQQRITSICRFIENQFSIVYNSHYMNFNSLSDYLKNSILDTKILVYFCSGTEEEIKEWFKIINIKGEPLNKQEELNAIYSGNFVTLAKETFSKSNGMAYRLGYNYIKGNPRRQEFLETALKWVSDGNIEEYMKDHKNDTNIDEIWSYFQTVIEWVNKRFLDYYEEMKFIDWGKLYRKYHNTAYDDENTRNEIKRLYQFGKDVIQNRKGIFEYVLDGCRNTQLLQVRIFNDSVKQKVYEVQTLEAKEKHISNCPLCALGNDNNKTRIWDYKEMEADHVTAWSKGGESNIKNCQMLCKTHNRAKGNS